MTEIPTAAAARTAATVSAYDDLLDAVSRAILSAINCRRCWCEYHLGEKLLAEYGDRLFDVLGRLGYRYEVSRGSLKLIW